MEGKNPISLSAETFEKHQARLDAAAKPSEGGKVAVKAHPKEGLLEVAFPDRTEWVDLDLRIGVELDTEALKATVDKLRRQLHSSNRRPRAIVQNEDGAFTIIVGDQRIPVTALPGLGRIPRPTAPTELAAARGPAN